MGYHDMWSKSYLQRPKDAVKTGLQDYNFTPSYEKSNICKPSMFSLLSWHYGRQWLIDRNEHQKTHKINTTPKYIKNDYETWLKKRLSNPKRIRRTIILKERDGIPEEKTKDRKQNGI